MLRRLRIGVMVLRLFIKMAKKNKLSKEAKEEIKQEVKKATRREIAKKSIKDFNKELRKALNTAIIAAFGFLMALVWRDVITGWVEKISGASPVQGKLISALLTTIICVLGILIVTKFLSEKKNEEKK